MARLAALAPFCLALGLWAGPGMSQTMPPVIPEILLTPSEGALTIEGVVSGTGPAEVTATLSIKHRGSGGQMSTRQSRDLSLTADASRLPVASTGLNFGEGSHLSVDLVVTVGDTVVAQTGVTIGAPE